MRRRPDHPSTGEPLGGRGAVWAAIRDVHRRFGDAFTTLEVACRALVPHATAQDYMRRLERAGFLAKASCAPAGGRYAAARFTLVRDAGVEAPRIRRDGTLDHKPTGQERLWSAMKAMTSFSVDDLRIATGIGEHTIKTYARRLERAGYLAVVKPGKPWHPGRWRLVRNTGPRAPGIRRRGKLPPGADEAQRVFDFNLGHAPVLTPAPEPTTRQLPAAPEPGNVVMLDAYRRARAAEAAPAVGADQERALKRKWIGRALRIADIAKAADRPATWARAARLLDFIHHARFESEIIHDLAAECALLALEEDIA